MIPQSATQLYSKMAGQLDLHARTPSELSSESDQKDASIDVKEVPYPSSENDEKNLLPTPPPLADRKDADPASGFGDAILRLLKIRKKRAGVDLDSVATQESVFDTDQGVFYHPKPSYEVGNVLLLLLSPADSRYRRTLRRSIPDSGGHGRRKPRSGARST